ncbi:hypothetical protein HX017_17430 [Myroides marinus]|uniref:hypothetical protein n=1 Tax=Myroides marinus TaxID=703342 RepID=UPI002578A002|nr:hypothetical protein [Myroides marinus]MDM1348755.1 hypothetical protein [Myroides marinus]MDM1352381.1 hypothetical protein [Myroides marinus]MDM1359587.1 hypothetical protein [Myroides marinus]MDM1366715.1 hypothetical protein [Myroides marinus]MDM1377304.1 hypothetical protein [Myroides marinus]
MGWFTDRSKSWEIKETVLLLGVIGIVSFLSLGVLTPFAVFFFGNRVRISHWLKVSFFISSIYLVFLILALFVFVAGENPVSILTLNYISFYIYVVYLSIYVPEYLQRLDLKNYINLEKNKEYSYHTIIQQMNDVRSDIPNKTSFIANLNRFKRSIVSQCMIIEINEILRLIEVIGVNNLNVTEVILERHVSTIENALTQYIELTTNYHQSKEVLDSIANLEELIKYARIALENELSMIIESQVLGVDGEASVYLSVLKGRGFV